MLAHLGVVALGQFHDEIVRPGQLSGANNPFQRHARLGQRNVLADGSVEQEVLLQHHAQLAAQPGRIGHG
ncbi:hypothetical protein D3C71_2213520 [compost metagenome]